MVRIFMMKAMAIYPGHRIHIDREGVVHDRDRLHEPFLIVERAMRDSQMKDIGQIQPAKKPAKNKINSAYQHPGPEPQMRWGGIHTSQQVKKNNQIACEVVYFHDGSRRVIQAEIGPCFKDFSEREAGAALRSSRHLQVKSWSSP